MRRTAQALTEADIAVYPVDARGLLSSGAAANEDDLEAQIGDPSDTETPVPTRGTPGVLDTMRVLADRTGGKAFYGTNDISRAIRRAMNNSRVTYTLGYYPTAVKWDGSFHQIKVKVAASGADVRARAGYYAIPDTPPALSKNNRTVISQLAASGLPATGIGLHLRTLPLKDSDSRSLSIEVQLDLHEIHMQQKQHHWAGEIQSVFIQLDDTGHVLQAEDRVFYPEFDPTSYERVLQTGIKDTRQIHV